MDRKITTHLGCLLGRLRPKPVVVGKGCNLPVIILYCQWASLCVFFFLEGLVDVGL